MRSIWNGSISFGLVTIPVKTYTATDRTSSVSFVRIHEKDGAQIQYRKVCELDGEEVPNEEVGKGYLTPDGEAVVRITDDDLSRLPMPTAKTLAILSFVDAAEIDPLQLDKAYYLGPNGLSAAKPYAVLREALEHHQKVAIGKVAMRGRETLAMLRAHDGAIVMHTLLWPDQVRPASGVAPENVKLRENELKLAETLMDSLGELDPTELHDDYREAVEQLVAAKLEGEEPVAAETSASPGAQVIDLTAALEKSVRAAQGAEPEAGAESATVTSLRGRKPAKRSAAGTKKTTTAKTAAAETAAAKTAPAKKTAGKKTTEKQFAARKPTDKAAEKKTAQKKPAQKKTAATTAKSTSTSASSTAKSSAGSNTRTTAKKTAAKKTSKKSPA
ncbi:non-homologous end joining protein Ku [Streptomyces halobius]|uniref:Non-homologous end joining protein Ku n=1 Tax=Streptomyces halobius TaxID=2879846 RepID=A0ABY4MIN7_9ACTN|nr:Ku protein [Streptomyces halobius]UQA97222.1 Ku protein [Streptomyces halobius]